MPGFSFFSKTPLFSTYNTQDKYFLHFRPRFKIWAVFVTNSNKIRCELSIGFISEGEKSSGSRRMCLHTRIHAHGGRHQGRSSDREKSKAAAIFFILSRVYAHTHARAVYESYYLLSINLTNPDKPFFDKPYDIR